jgi:hypothetical protein
VTWRSGSSIRGERSSRRGNKVPERALFPSAFAALEDPLSRAYYDRKRAQGRKHNQALIALARHRCDVIYAMLRDGTPCCPDPRLFPSHLGTESPPRCPRSGFPQARPQAKWGHPP